MKNHLAISRRDWYVVFSCSVGLSLIASLAEAKPKVRYSVQSTIEIKQSKNGWTRPSQEYISVDPHTKAIQKRDPPLKKGEYQVNIVYPTKGPLAIRVPPQNNSGRGRLLNSVQSNSSTSAAVKKDGSVPANSVASSSADRARRKTSAVSNTVQDNATPASYEANYGQPKKRKY